MDTLNIIIIGDRNVGVYTYYNNIGSQNTYDNISFFENIKYSLRNVSVEKQTIETRIFKLLPGSRYKKIRQTYYEGTHGAVILFDVINRDSLAHVGYYVKEVVQRKLSGSNFPFVVLGTKIDLRVPGSDFVSDEEAETFCTALREQYSNENITLKFFPVSLKTNENIDSSFQYIVKQSSIFMDSIIKILLLGERYVGITTFFRKYCKSWRFTEFSASADTNVVEISYKNVLSNNTKLGAEFCRVKDHLFASKYFPGVLPKYFQSSHIGVFMFDVTNRYSFLKVDDFINDFLKYNTNENIFIILLGSKIDLRNTFPDSITDDEVALYRSEVLHQTSRAGLRIAYFPTSLKTDTNIQNFFDSISEYSSLRHEFNVKC